MDLVRRFSLTIGSSSQNAVKDAVSVFSNSSRTLTKVNLQHPFWGDVSYFSRCEAAFLKTQTKPDLSEHLPPTVRHPVQSGSGDPSTSWLPSSVSAQQTARTRPAYHRVARKLLQRNSWWPRLAYLDPLIVRKVIPNPVKLDSLPAWHQPFRVRSMKVEVTEAQLAEARVFGEKLIVRSASDESERCRRGRQFPVCSDIPWRGPRRNHCPSCTICLPRR